MMRSGSRWSPGWAITKRAPTLSGQKISHKDAAGNSESGNQILSNFNPWFIDAKYGFKTSGVPVTLSATFINNPAAYSSEDTGYSLGVKYGQTRP